MKKISSTAKKTIRQPKEGKKDVTPTASGKAVIAEKKPQEPVKDIILYTQDVLDSVIARQIKAVRTLSRTTGTKYKYALLLDNKLEFTNKAIAKKIDILIRTNTKHFNMVEDALLPYKDRIAAVINRMEFAMPLYIKLTQLFPYLNHPTPRSVQIANDKIEMRRTLKKYAPDIIPKFTIITDAREKTARSIEQNIGFPCIIKPANLFSSKLITVCFYREELRANLQDSFKKISAIYKEARVEHEPQILIEQLMEGDMYSIDGYVDAKGKISFTPPIEIRTGRDIGYDDFFLYSQITPSKLKKAEIGACEEAAAKAIHAFGFRSCSAHVELYKTADGFKIIELASRVGGYRGEILGYAYGIRHHLNDLLIHMGMAPRLKKTKKKHVVFLKFWPREVGVLKSVKGFKKISEQNFVAQSRQLKKPGEKIGPAKYGEPQTCEFYLVADSRTELLGHIRKVEKAIDIVIEK